MPTWRNVAQVLPEPHAAVERMVACVLGHQRCQALAAAGGGQRPGFTVLVTQPESATATDGSRYSSANIYGFTPALTHALLGRSQTPPHGGAVLNIPEPGLDVRDRSGSVGLQSREDCVEPRER